MTNFFSTLILNLCMQLDSFNIKEEEKQNLLVKGVNFLHPGRRPGRRPRPRPRPGITKSNFFIYDYA